MPARNRRLALVFLLIWSFLVLYPRPTALGESLYRLFVPPIEAGAMLPLLAELPEKQEPAELEKYILERFPYYYDWQVYGFPWYFPTPAEALEKGKGDCKTRFIVLASLFTALEIPYELFISPTHIWVSYEGKKENPIENLKVALFYRDDEGIALKLPRINWRESATVTWEAFWVYMPPQRKRLLLAGLVFTFLLFFVPAEGRRL